MQNVLTSSQVDSAVEAAIEAATTPELAQDTTTAVAVLDAPAPEAPPAEEIVAAQLVEAATQEAPKAEPEAQEQPLVYTKADLLNAREFLLKAKQAGKFGGFGMKSGPMIRNAIGYKFDSMDVKDVLKAMAAPDFLAKYQATTDHWYANVKHDGNTGKSNFARHTEASRLTIDATSFATLVKSLRIVCERNQDWQEKGLNLSLSMNGHRALMDFFGIQVTNSRRLKLAAH